MITSLLIENLLSDVDQLRQAAIILAYNISWTISQSRKLVNERVCEYDESWVTEILAAVCDALEKESNGAKDDELLFRLVSTIGFLTILATASIQELFEMLAKETLKSITSSRCKPLVKELLEL